MIKQIAMSERTGKFSLGYLHKTLKGFKATYLNAPVKSGTKFDHSLLIGNKTDMKIHMEKLEKYLESHPEDIESKAQLAKLREILIQAN